MKLFVYDHCPYCVKARMIFGLKNVDFDLVTLLNDDEETPISMIGKKMVPILELEDGKFMAESMDIVDYVNGNFGKDKSVINYEVNEDINAWVYSISDYLYQLAMPRWAKADLEEFKTQSAIDYFTKKKEDYVGPFAQNLANSEKLIKAANFDLKELNEILENHNYPSEDGKIIEGDIHLFAILRSLSIVKGIEYGDLVEKYRQKMSEICKIPLHDDIAL